MTKEQNLLKQIHGDLTRLNKIVSEPDQKEQLEEILLEIKKLLDGAEPPPFKEIYPKAKAVADLLLEMFKHYVEHEIIKDGIDVMSKLF